MRLWNCARTGVSFTGIFGGRTVDPPAGPMRGEEQQLREGCFCSGRGQSDGGAGLWRRLMGECWGSGVASAMPCGYLGKLSFSLVGVLLLLALAVGPLGYMFFREWRWKRSYRKIEQNSGPKRPIGSNKGRAPLITEAMREKQSEAMSGRGGIEKPRSGSGERGAPARAIERGASYGAAAAGQTGRVTIEASEQQCEIYIDGMYYGNPPARVLLSVGQHVIEMRMAGQKPYQKEFVLRGGDEINMRAKFER